MEIEKLNCDFFNTFDYKVENQEEIILISFLELYDMCAILQEILKDKL